MRFGFSFDALAFQCRRSRSCQLSSCISRVMRKRLRYRSVPARCPRCFTLRSGEGTKRSVWRGMLSCRAADARGAPGLLRAAHHFAKTRTPPECVSLRSCHGGRGPGNPPSSASKLFLVMRAPLVKRVGATEVPAGTAQLRRLTLIAATLRRTAARGRVRPVSPVR
jgi:hypothetical protein